MLADFLQDDTGAISVDWVALTGGVLLLGLAVLFAVFSNGAAVAVASVNDTLRSTETNLCGALEEADDGLECPPTD